MATYNFTNAVIVEVGTTPRIISSGVSVTLTDADNDNTLNFSNNDATQTVTVNSVTNNVNPGSSDAPAALGTAYNVVNGGTNNTGVGTGTLIDNNGVAIPGFFVRVQNAGNGAGDDFVVFIPTAANAGFTNAAASGGVVGNLVNTQYTFGQVAGAGNDNFDISDDNNNTARNWNMGAGNDTAVASGGNDTISGGSGNDSLSGLAGNDQLFGGDGNDTLIGGAGNDQLFGGIGADLITDTDGVNTVDGGAGNDTVSITGAVANQSVAGGDGDDLITIFNGAASVNTIDGGAGNDTINGGDAADSVLGGAGDDLLQAGNGNDTVFGGIGNDTIIDFGGNDSSFGGDGNDTIFGSAGADRIAGDAGIDRVDYSGSAAAVNITATAGLGGDAQGDILSDVEQAVGSAFNDTISGFSTVFGGSGNDNISGTVGADSLDAGSGNDTVLGGGGADTIQGGAGNDTITGGAGADTLLGEADRDQFQGGSGAQLAENYGDSADGGETGDDFDQLVFGNKSAVRVIRDPGNAENGTVNFLDQNGNVIGSMTFTNMEQVVPCFTPGTMIATDHGPCRVEHLRVGDRVLTRDDGLQDIRWIGTRMLSAAQLAATPAFRPVRVPAHLFGPGMPARDVWLSPNHRLLSQNPRASLYFGEHEVLVAAKFLPGLQASVQVQGVTYIHLLFDAHQIVLSDGIWTESYLPGDQTLGGLEAGSRAEILALFPELSMADATIYPSARRILKRHEARVLV